MTTSFVEHYPTASLRTKQEETRNLIWQFDHVAHFAGHNHVASQRTYTNPMGNASFVDYIAPYPHTWYGAPGFYAALVSSTEGVLQVKRVDIPGLEDGTPCDNSPSGNCGMCNSGSSYWYDESEFRCGRERDFESGRVCIPYLSCYTCSGDEYSFWHTNGFFACGEEPKLVDGTPCRRLTSCRACNIDPTNWSSVQGLACGVEP